MNAPDIFQQLNLTRPPEDGYYRETYRSTPLMVAENDQSRNSLMNSLGTVHGAKLTTNFLYS